MTEKTPRNPLPEENESSQRDMMNRLASLREEVSTSASSVVASIESMEARRQADYSKIIEQIKSQSESKIWKVTYVILPVVLGFVIWGLQLNTNQKIDSTSKKLATRLALTEAFYKKKLAVYEDADKQMAGIMESLKVLRLDPSDSSVRKLVTDNVTKLSELSKTNGLFLTKDVSEGLTEVAFMAAGMTNAQPAIKLQPLTDKIASVEKAMTDELQGQMGSLD
jgi:hypothetical protein